MALRARAARVPRRLSQPRTQTPAQPLLLLALLPLLLAGSLPPVACRESRDPVQEKHPGSFASASSLGHIKNAYRSLALVSTSPPPMSLAIGKQWNPPPKGSKSPPRSSKALKSPPRPKPGKKRNPPPRSPPPPPWWTPCRHQLPYNGGGMLVWGNIHVHIVFYGNWSRVCMGVITGLINSFSNATVRKATWEYKSSDWWSTVQKYRCDSRWPACPTVPKQAGVKTLVLGKVYNDKYSKGPALSQGTLLATITDRIAAGVFPLDQNAIYLVLTSGDVNVPGFCKYNCGLHGTGGMMGRPIPWGWVGNPDGCRACAYDYLVPNGCWGASGMASNILHELAELATNPYGLRGDRGYIFANRWENGDYCNTQRRHALGTPNGAYNLYAGDLKFTVQSILDPITLECNCMPDCQGNCNTEGGYFSSW